MVPVRNDFQCSVSLYLLDDTPSPRAAGPAAEGSLSPGPRRRGVNRACHPAATWEQGRKVDLGEIFHACGPAYRKTHRLSGDQLAVMRAIESCRTAVLGGHLLTCQTCGASLPSRVSTARKGLS
ncbi:MAG TPA: hypothetical protein ENJ94_03475, partial [Gammaproteobacteria bacterium]|nr:hypothetical protein [Gammaproteobacteria bacterium]